jgi:hypothetical protein
VKALAGLVVAVVATALVASAATFTIPPSIMQVNRIGVEFDDPEQAEPFAITVKVRFFNSGNGNHVRDAEPQVHEVPEGYSYTIGWTGGGRLVSCDDVAYPDDDLPELYDAADGPYTPTADATHVLCVQTGEGTVSFVVTAPGDGG